jgi:Flp pilus assembly protein TadD
LRSSYATGGTDLKHAEGRRSRSFQRAAGWAARTARHRFGGSEAQFRQGRSSANAEISKARRHFQRATEMNPQFSQAFFYLGMSALHMDDRAAAEAALRRAIKLEPSAVNALYNLGVLLLDNKKPADAAKYFEKAKQAGPMSPELAINLIRANLESGQTARAVAVAEEAGPQFAGSVEFDQMIGNLFLARGVAGPACSALRAADRLQPQRPDIALPLATACLESRDIATARAALAGIREKASASPQYHALAARVHFLAGEKEGALEEMNAAAQLAPRDPVLLLTLGRYYQKYGEQQKAVAVLEKAAALDPKTPEIPYSLAVSYITAEDEPAAIEYLRRALALDPHFDRALFLLGSIHLAFDRPDEAEKPMAEALRLRPKIRSTSVFRDAACA